MGSIAALAPVFQGLAVAEAKDDDAARNAEDEDRDEDPDPNPEPNVLAIAGRPGFVHDALTIPHDPCAWRASTALQSRSKL